MPTSTIRINVTRRVGPSTAAALGCTVAVRGDECELAAPYRDQAQLTGLLVQLGDLNLSYNRVDIVDQTPSRNSR